MISFLSVGWGGRTSNKRIVNESGFLDLVDPGDVILADRGFTINSELLMRHAKHEIHPPSSGMEQQTADVAKTKKVAICRFKSKSDRVAEEWREAQTAWVGYEERTKRRMESLLSRYWRGTEALDEAKAICGSTSNWEPTVIRGSGPVVVGWDASWSEWDAGAWVTGSQR